MCELPHLQSEALRPTMCPACSLAISAGGHFVSPVGCSDPRARVVHHASSVSYCPHFRSSRHPPPGCTLGTGGVLQPPPAPGTQGCDGARGAVPLPPPLPPGPVLIQAARVTVAECARTTASALGTNSRGPTQSQGPVRPAPARAFLLHLFSAARGLRCCPWGLSLPAAGGGCSLVLACGLLVALASLVAEQGLW